MWAGIVVLFHNQLRIVFVDMNTDPDNWLKEIEIIIYI